MRVCIFAYPAGKNAAESEEMEDDLEMDMDFDPDVQMPVSGAGGKYEEITWSRADNDSQFTFTYADGSEVEYTVGQTYYCIISESGAVTFA